MSQARTARRYAVFSMKKRKKLLGLANVVTCKACGNPTRNQHACPSCGSYRGRSVTNMEKVVEKVTKVKA